MLDDNMFVRTCKREASFSKWKKQALLLKKKGEEKRLADKQKKEAFFKWEL